MAGSLHGLARTTPRVRAELQALQDTSSALAQRHGISRLPENPDKGFKRVKIAATAIGYVHIAAANTMDFRDISELRLAQGKLNMFLAIDQVSKAKPIGLCRVHLRRVPRRRRTYERL